MSVHAPADFQNESRHGWLLRLRLAPSMLLRGTERRPVEWIFASRRSKTIRAGGMFRPANWGVLRRQQSGRSG